MTINLKRYFSLMKLDLTLEMKYGFFQVTFIVMVFWIFVLSNLNSNILLNLFPFFILSNMTITSFYFTAAMVLFEKNERTIHQLKVTPLRFWEYATSKLFTLSLLAVFESLIIVIIIFNRFSLNYLLIGIGLFLLSLTNGYLGIIVISKYNSITDFFFPSVAWLSLTSIPVLWFLGFGTSLFQFFFVIPTMGPFVIISNGFGFASSQEMIISLVLTSITIPFLHKIADHRFNSYIVKEVK